MVTNEKEGIHSSRRLNKPMIDKNMEYELKISGVL